MRRKSASVKPRRKYESEARRLRAEQTRARIIEVSRRYFLADGYARTTVAAIARTANVSEETIFKVFGGKPGLVRAIWERGLEGSGPVPAEQRSDAMRAAATDPRAIIEAWGQFVTEVAPLGVPVLLLVREAAASDIDMAELFEAIDRARLERMMVNARDLFDRGFLRPGVGVDEARDVLWLYSSAELYELLVIRQGWPIDRYGTFVAEGMKAALLP
jgi:AcrR family transcriptional regulator